MKANYENGVYRQLKETRAEIADLKASMQEMKKQHETGDCNHKSCLA